MQGQEDMISRDRGGGREDGWGVGGGGGGEGEREDVEKGGWG